MLQPSPTHILSSPCTFYGSTELEGELNWIDPWNMMPVAELTYKNQPQTGLFIHWLDFDPTQQSYGEEELN
jgi:hypothetical protein